jgi:Mg2+-importing ATPase
MLNPHKAKQQATNSAHCEHHLKSISSLHTKDLYKKYNIAFDKTETPTGLSARDAEHKLDKYGENKIVLKHQDTTLTRILSALINPFNIVLAIISAVTYATDVLTSGEADWVTIFIILAMILVSSAVSFIQSERSSRAAAKLADLIENNASVYRNGELLELPMSDLVPGDIIKLSAGDMLPADARFLTTKDTFVAQAALTGESNPVEKSASSHVHDPDSITDLKNIGFAGTNIVSGSATAVIVLTGNNTYFGSMAKTLNNEKAKNSFERGVGAVSKLLIRMVIIMVPLVFLVNGFLKADWSASLLFAVSVAVGLTPEMLPVIMTSTLATGAVKMARHKVIVKQLGAIQTFGEMDILCTDKTGTLTENKVILEKYLNPRGRDDPSVLNSAYLNSYFQTGLKGLIDLAVINRAEATGLTHADYATLDEIPFDFTRRRMSVIIEDKTGKRTLITKGAVEEMLAVCSYIKTGNKTERLTATTRAAAMKTYEKYNDEGLRMLAVAERHISKNHTDEFTVNDEMDLVLVGFVGFLDPPKASARAAIASLKKNGIRTIVLTGDSVGVAALVCEKVGINSKHILTGKDIEHMDDAALVAASRNCELFAKLSPAEKERVVRILQEAGHTVGYMGDGINDAPPLHQADVGISVDTAVDIAKETANIILMKKDLTVLETGVLEGRRTFGNVTKYIKLAVSGNFGNMISVLVASAVLPFLPMLPIQILTQNLLSDFAALGFPFDKMDSEYMEKPRKWDPKSITTFMLCLGPISSLFDIACFAVLWYIFGYRDSETLALFQTGWFIFGTLSQILVIYVARTGKIPFLESRPGWPLALSTLAVGAVAVLFAFTTLADGFMMSPLPPTFIPWLLALLLAYFLLVQLAKHFYKKWFHDWL